MKSNDLTGMKFGYWTVLEKDKPHEGARNSYWVCKCRCGTVRSVSRFSLVGGSSQSCGCWEGIHRKGINKTHGMSKTRLYNTWLSMRKRCNNPNDKYANSYYNKGIRVCDEWNNDFVAFMNWAYANGYTDELTIDRIDNDKGYSPDNCRWTTSDAQQRNKTNNIMVEYDNKQWCLKTLCKEIGFPYKTAHRRYIRRKRANKPVTTEYLFAPIHDEKIPYVYRK